MRPDCGVSRGWLRLIVAAILMIAMPVWADDALRVMTFNVRLPVDGDGPDRWDARQSLFIDTVRRAQPDVMGTQELFATQGDAIVGALPEYRWFGRGRRDGGSGDEHMGVFYRHDRLTVEQSGDFWLSDTPDVPGSITWGNLYPRMVTWALFREQASGRRFYLFNTHWPYRDEDAAIRERCADALLAHIATLPDDVSVIVLGDFNAAPDTPEYRRMAQGFDDVWTKAAHRRGPAETFHGFTGKADRRIDWIFVRGFDAGRVRTITDHRGERYPSDHFPVFATLRWSASP